jgi:hypothetical protein
LWLLQNDKTIGSVAKKFSFPFQGFGVLGQVAIGARHFNSSLAARYSSVNCLEDKTAFENKTAHICFHQGLAYSIPQSKWCCLCLCNFFLIF